ncbi:MAG TPA: diaminopimelate decarboxylase [Rhizomicrobium sp.]|jgi:diaminopimelate decarboxylase
MNHFRYQHGRLFAEDVDLANIAEAVGTPFYVYSTATLERHYRAMETALPKGTLIAYSVKANGNLAVLKTLAGLGAGADVVSGGELKKALAAGIPAGKIVFSGVGKTQAEMKLALEAGIHQFNVESEPELVALNDVARSLDARAAIAFRVNPDVDARTHAKITTGTAEAKFGIPWSRAVAAHEHAEKLAHIDVVGIDMHIGSQITELAPFEAALSRVIGLIKRLRADEHEISRFDIGGGLGVPYGKESELPTPEQYGALVTRLTKDLEVSLIAEPGRLIAAKAGALVSRVIYVKDGETKRFAVLDAGMNDLIRPALYDAHHAILSVNENTSAPTARYDVVGPVCESSDLFARDYLMAPLASGDLVAIMTAGAYGAVMASAYNARLPAAEVLVKGGQWSVVRPKLDDDALIRQDRLPPWLEA